MSEKDPKLSVNESIPIISSYLPFDIIDEYYEFDHSDKLVPKGNSKDPCYYVATYSLTDKGKEAFSKKEHDYSGTIDIVIEENAGVVSSATIGFGTPRWMSSAEDNEYERSDWKVKFK